MLNYISGAPIKGTDFWEHLAGNFVLLVGPCRNQAVGANDVARLPFRPTTDRLTSWVFTNASGSFVAAAC